MNTISGKNKRIGAISASWAVCSLTLSLSKEYLTHSDADAAVSSSPSSSSSFPRDEVKVSHYPPKNAVYRSYWTLKYDQRTRNPKWTYEHLYRSDFTARGSGNHEKLDRKKAHFFPEHSIQDDKFKIVSKDYADCPFDRGHLIPAADFKLTQKSLKSTFSMANISPQFASMNRGIWESLEAFIRSLLTSSEHPFDEIEVISGPVFAPVYSNGKWMYIHNTIGTFPKLITVPSHFFKVVVSKKFVPLENNPDIDVMKKSLAAFLVPNADLRMNDGKSLSSYLIRLDQLESLIGFTLFDDQMTAQEKAECDAKIPMNRDLKILLDLENKDKDRWVPILDDGASSRISQKDRWKNTCENTDIDVAVAKFTHLCSVVNCNCILK